MKNPDSNAVTCDVEELQQLLDIMELNDGDENSMECNVSNIFDAADPSQGSIFNFSLIEVCNILKERQKNDRHMNNVAEFILILVYSILIISGLATNLAVSFVVARRTQMHTPRNLYIVNLTISDISLCVVSMPFTLTRLIKRHWTLGNFLCKLVPALQCANIMVSTGTIAAIALDRYFTIVKRSPAESGGVTASVRRQRVVLSIAAIWIISILATVPLLITQRVERVAVENVLLYETCIESWKSSEIKLVYTIFTLIVMYVIPIAVVVAVHISIAKFLTSHASHIDSSSNRAKREIARNRRTTILLSGIAVLFAVSWMPHYMLSLVVDINPNLISAEDLYVATAVCHVIAMSSAISNPIVYGWLNTNIRREFLSLLPASLVSNCCEGKISNTRRAANGVARSGNEGDAFGLSVGPGVMGDSTALFEESPAKGKGGGVESKFLLVPRPTMTKATVSTQLVSEM